MGAGAPVAVNASTGATIYFKADGTQTTDASLAAAELVVEPNGSYTLTVTGAMSHEYGDGTDAALTLPVPVLDLNDTRAVADFILREAGLV